MMRYAERKMLVAGGVIAVLVAVFLHTAYYVSSYYSLPDSIQLESINVTGKRLCFKLKAPRHVARILIERVEVLLEVDGKMVASGENLGETSTSKSVCLSLSDMGRIVGVSVVVRLEPLFPDSLFLKPVETRIEKSFEAPASP